MECRLANLVRDQQGCPVGRNSKQEHGRGGNWDVHYLSTGAGHLHDVRTRGGDLVSVKPRAVRTDQILLIAVVSDRYVARYYGRREWARLQIDKYCCHEKNKAAASGCPRLPSKPAGFGSGRRA